MVEKTTYVNVRPTADSVTAMKDFTNQLATANESVKEMLKAFQSLSTLTKTIKINSAFGDGGQDFQKYSSGLAYVERQRADNLRSLGTHQGRVLDQEKKLVRETEQGARQLQKIADTRRAIGLDVSKEYANIKRMTDLKQLELVKAQALKREVWAQANASEMQVAKAQVLQRVIDRRIGSLREEARVQKAAASTPKAVAQRSRDLSMERLFGDGGASLFKIQAGLAANYLLMNQVRTAAQGAATFTIDLDMALRNLQAIVKITDTNMGSLRDRLIDVSEETKFTALEVTNAAVILGQAGLSSKEIEDSVRAIALLATATGTDLANAVDIATSTLGVFNMESSHMATVANVMTEAVNSSKLDIEKLTLGLQYAGNTAAQSGVGFDELTAAFGAMSNAGIRSGSTLGTGMRQIMISLQKPSKDFQETLARLGLTMDDVDLRSKGLYGALKSLRDAGFTSADAIKAFEVRAAAAYTALSGNLDQMLDLRDSFLHTTAASQANETQMKSLANQARRVGGILGSLAYEGLEPVAMFLRDLLIGLGDALTVLREWPGTVKLVTTAIISMGVAFAAVRVGALLSGLMQFGKFLPGIVAGLAGLGASATGAAGGVALLSRALSLSWVGGIAIALTGLVYLFQGLRGGASESAGALEQAQSALDRNTGSADALNSRLKTLDGTIQGLRDRQKLLSSDSHLLGSTTESIRAQFREMGKDASVITGSVDELITVLKNLRAEMAQKYVAQVELVVQDLGSLISKTQTNSLSKLQTAREGLLNTNGLRNRFSARASGVRQRQQILDTLDPSLNLDQVSVANSGHRARLAAIQEQIRTGQFSRFSDEGNQLKLEEDFLVKLIAAGEARVADLDMIKGLQAKLNQTRQTELAAREATNPSVGALIDGSKAFASASQGRVQAAGPGANAIEGYTRAAQALEEEQETAGEMLRSLQVLRDSGLITSESLFQEITQTISNGLALAQTVRDELAEDAGKVKDALAARGVEGAQNQVKEAQKALEASTSLGQAGANLVNLNKAIADYAKKKAAAVLASTDDPLIKELDQKDLDLEVAGLRKDGNSAMAQKIQDMARKSISAIFDRFKLLSELADRELENRLSSLNGELDSAKTVPEAEAAYSSLVGGINTQFDRRAFRERFQAGGDSAIQAGLDAVRTQNQAQALQAAAQALENATSRVTQNTAKAQEQLTVLREQSRIHQLIAVFGEDSRIVANARLESERRIQFALIDQMELADDLNEELKAAWNAEQAMAGMNLSGPIWDAVSAAGALAGKLGSAVNQLSEIGRSTIFNKIRLATVGQPVERARQEAQANFSLNTGYNPQGNGFVNKALGVVSKVIGGAAAYNAQIEQQVDAAEKAWSEASGGGGGGGGRGGHKKKRIDETLEHLTNQIEAAKINIDNGFSNDFATMDKTLAASNAELDRRAAAIRNLAADSSRTKEEEAQLTELLREHTNLSEFIKQREEEIFQLKDKQGVAQLDVNQTLKDWADSSLNMGATLRDGVGSVLDNLSTGFADLFTDLSNGTKKAGEAFRDFGLSVVKSLQGVVAKMLAIKIMQSVIGMVGGGEGGTDELQGLMNLALGIPGKMTGGIIRKAGGGLVRGNLARDSKLHMLMPDEYVLRSSATQAIGVDTLDQINSMGNRKAMGGLSGIGRPQGGMGTTNVWVVSPEQKPVPGPNDIVAIIADDMARGGPTKKLVKSIQSGQL